MVNQQERSEKSVLDCASATDALARPSRCGIYSDILSALMTGMTRYPGVSYRHATTRSGVLGSAGVTPRLCLVSMPLTYLTDARA